VASARVKTFRIHIPARDGDDHIKSPSDLVRETVSGGEGDGTAGFCHKFQPVERMANTCSASSSVTTKRGHTTFEDWKSQVAGCAYDGIADRPASAALR